MSKNTGKWYEQQTKRICQIVLAAKQVKVLELCPNESRRVVILRSPATTHQIDVYWRYEVDGHEHRVLVQCKDWKDGYDIPKVELLAFAKIVDLMGNHTKGIFVTRTGYQSGALAVASYCGIEPLILRNPISDKDWEGYRRRINIINKGTHIGAQLTNIEWDDVWLKAELRRLEFPKGETLVFDPRIDQGRDWLYDEEDQPVMTLDELIMSQVPNTNEPLPLRHERLPVRQPLYLHNTGNARIPRRKVAAIFYDLWINTTRTELTVTADSYVDWVLRNALPGATNSLLVDHVLAFDKTGNAVQRWE